MQPRSFLEFCFHRLLGKPVSGSCWNCPVCDSSGASLSVRPPKEEYKVRFKCFRCDWWGDEFDLLREFYKGDDYPRLRIRVEQWRADYEAELANPSNPSGDGEIPERNSFHYQTLALRELLETFEKWETTDAHAFQIIGAALETCDRYQVDPREVLKDWRRWFSSKVWWSQIEEQIAKLKYDANGFPVLNFPRNGRR